MTPNHSGGSATVLRPLATSSDSSAVEVVGSPVGAERGRQRNPRGEIGEHPATFERQVPASHLRSSSQRPDQPVIETPGAEESALDEHLPALFRGRATRRDEHEPSVRVGGLAGRVPR